MASVLGFDPRYSGSIPLSPAIYALRIADSTTDSDSVGDGPTPSGRAN